MNRMLSTLAAILPAPAAFAAPLLVTQPGGGVKTFSREALETLPRVEVARMTGEQTDLIPTLTAGSGTTHG